ncbi:MAG: hypothetical protein SGI83_15230 [Bacteroidota bacterium]|nr:hypothetical protein [Bacteroidota bacterium]
MKNLRTIAVCVSILFYNLNGMAQTTGTIPINEPDYNKPKLFSNLPDKIPVSIDQLNSLFSSAIGSQVSVDVPSQPSVQFNGELVSTVSKYGNSLQSVIIRSTNYNGARFTVSKITDAEGKISYAGRIISFQHGDLFELKKLDTEWVLVKKDYHELVNE